ncbi:hypothetical protein RRF57_005413 [Xylaria bambusicola]|uniref:V-ATPase proteolipid subunit C-like domain-containing protein n=1 Tax=Xylaria bambusicola TaxID=326684 RepID=A0AAN7UHV4_9PEZI
MDGASYGTAKSAGAIFSSGIIRPERLMQNTYALVRLHLFLNRTSRSKTQIKRPEKMEGRKPSFLTSADNRLCAIMAQILSIYGLVSSVIIQGDLEEKMPLYQGFVQFGAGISVGLCGLAAGFAIGIVGDAGVRASTQQPRLYIGMVLILIFAEVLGLYGVVVCVLMLTRSRQNMTQCLY